jgi:hypothetical protein
MPDTAVLPLPVATGHTLRRDRCVVELSVRLLRFPVLRGRLPATGGRWTPGSRFTVTLDPAVLRTGIPFLRRAFAGSPELTFAADDVLPDPLVLDGWVATREVRLRGDVRHRDDRSIVVWAAGVVPPPRRKPRRLNRVARFLAGRRLHVEIAIEFVR